jgi:hypothetical protein
MANIVDSALNVEGSSELVEQFLQALPGLIRDDKKTIYCKQSKREITCEREGPKTASVSFETKWRAPYDVVMAAVRKYHHPWPRRSSVVADASDGQESDALSFSQASNGGARSAGYQRVIHFPICDGSSIGGKPKTIIAASTFFCGLV